jgi:omega-6 fatty acid desaturase (delta-12 desaturase)
MWPRRGDATRGRLWHVTDRLLVVLMATALAWAALAQGGGVWHVACVVALPFAVLTWTIGFVVYFNHTHPDVPWFDDRTQWSHVSGQVDGTVHLSFPPRAGTLFGNIMNHAAHHVHPGVPLANLDAAQAHLDGVLGGRARCEVWSPAVHARIVRACKLYDYERMQWLDFEGRPTTAAASELGQPLLQPAHP